MRANLRGLKCDALTRGRSSLMRQIRAGGNLSTEVRLRMTLVNLGIRGWKVRSQGMRGKPDFYFPQQSAVVFIAGCFWHACESCFGRRTLRNNSFWQTNFRNNQERDRAVTAALSDSGLLVIRIWEYELKREPQKRVIQLIEELGLETRLKPAITKKRTSDEIRL